MPHPARVGRREFLSLRPSRETSDPWVRVFRRAMACRFEVALPGRDASRVAVAREALDVVAAAEERLSHFRESSELAQVNRLAAQRLLRISPSLHELLLLCRRLHAETDGAFDATATPLSRAWGFLDRDWHVPEAGALQQARACVGFDKVLLEDRSAVVRFGASGVELSFGAVGKGWALDLAGERLRRSGVRQALLSAGGSSFVAVGGESGEFCVEIRPDREAPLGRVRLAGEALGVSTASEQFFEAGGRRYGHILDPRTGQPAEGVRAAAVIAPRAAEADALATAFFVGGPGLAQRYCAAHEGVLALVAPEDGGPVRAFGGPVASEVEEP